MAEMIEERLRQVLPDMPSEDVRAVAAFAEFLAHRRRPGGANGERELSDEEHSHRLALLNAVAALSAESGPPVSNRDHDRYLYGAH